MASGRPWGAGGGAGPHLPSHAQGLPLAITPISRSHGRSAVAAAAYRLAQRLWDDRGDCWRDYRAKRDVVHGEHVGWSGEVADLWNRAEAAETRVNSRVAREFTISLPCELPLVDQVGTARGFCLWLRDSFGIASTFAIHHPYLGGLDREIMEDLLGETRRPTEHRGDPRNHHLHVLATTRRWNPETSALGEKVRAFDDREEGPATVQRCRDEWQRRVNAKLAKCGVAERVDLRSHATRAAAGEGPEGLVSQPKVGAAAAGRARRERRETGETTVRRVLRREEVQAHNEEVWQAWEAVRALRRQALREQGAGAEIAAAREVERRQARTAGVVAPERAAPTVAPKAAHSPQAARRVPGAAVATVAEGVKPDHLARAAGALEGATSQPGAAAVPADPSRPVTSGRTTGYDEAIRWARSGAERPVPGAASSPPSSPATDEVPVDWDAAIDPETYDMPYPGAVPSNPMRVLRKAGGRGRERVRSLD